MFIRDRKLKKSCPFMRKQLGLGVHEKDWSTSISISASTATKWTTIEPKMSVEVVSILSMAKIRKLS